MSRHITEKIQMANKHMNVYEHMNEHMDVQLPCYSEY